MATTVGDVMSAPYPGVARDDTVVAVAVRLRDSGFGAVPVCGTGGEFLGLVTATDIIDRCVADGCDPRLVAAESLLPGPQPFVGPTDRLDTGVLSDLLAQPLPILPVVQEGRLVGILTVDDIAGHLVDESEEDGGYQPFPWGGAAEWPTSR